MIHTLDRRDFVIWGVFCTLIAGLSAAAGYWGDSLGALLGWRSYPAFTTAVIVATLATLLAPPLLAWVAGRPLARAFAGGGALSALALLALVSVIQLAADLPYLPWPLLGALAGLALGLAWAAVLRTRRLLWLAICAGAGAVAALFAVANTYKTLIDIRVFGLLWAPLVALPLGWLLRLSYPPEGAVAGHAAPWTPPPGDAWRMPIPAPPRTLAEQVGRLWGGRPQERGDRARFGGRRVSAARPQAQAAGLRSTLSLLSWGLPTLALAGAAVLLGESLRPCAWLDQALGSSCAREITVAQPADRFFMITDLIYAPDGQTLIVGGGSTRYGEVRLYRVADGALLRSMPMPDYVDELAIVPDTGRLLAVDMQGELRIYEIASGQELLRAALGERVWIPDEGPRISVDGRLALFDQITLDLQSGAIEPAADRPDLLLQFPELLNRRAGFAGLGVTTPDGRLRTVLVKRAGGTAPNATYANNGYDIALVDAATEASAFAAADDLGPGAVRLAGPVPQQAYAALAPDGALLASQYNDGQIRPIEDQMANIHQDWLRVWRVSDGATVLATTLPDVDMLLRPAWSPDSTTIAVASIHSSVVRLYRVRP